MPLVVVNGRRQFVIVRTPGTAVLMATGAWGLFHHVYSKDLAGGVPAHVALSQAQTITVSTVILFRIFYLFNCRRLKGSILQIGLISNPSVFIGVAVLLLLQAAFIYAPFLRGVFGSSPIELEDMSLAVLVGASILPLIAI